MVWLTETRQKIFREVVDARVLLGKGTVSKSMNVDWTSEQRFHKSN